MQLSRRVFLGAARASRKAVVRPPWAVDEARFLELCSRCDDCLKACPTGLLIPGDGGFPEADFTPGRAPEGCTFCGDCVTACSSGALHRAADTAPWQLQIAIGDECLAARQVVCRTCGDLCDARAIHFPPTRGGVSRPALDAAACTGCGACLADCPVRAIRIVSSSQHSPALRGAA